MTFTSWQFALFATIVFGVYYLPPVRPFQVQLLVAASLFFYGYGQPELLPLLALAVCGTYLFLILALGERRWLPVGIIFNLVLLAFFKYKFLLFDPNAPVLAGVPVIDFLLKLPLPVGISFFVFHNISLLVYLTREKKAPPPGLVDVFLYIIFFPQLVSGPITRAGMSVRCSSSQAPARSTERRIASMRLSGQAAASASSMRGSRARCASTTPETMSRKNAASAGRYCSPSTSRPSQ